MNETILGIVAQLQAVQKVSFNEEQLAFITAEPGNIKSESLPGTGKTFSVINRMIVLELGYQIPGKKILAMSFTNMATSEMEVKHQKLCTALGIESTPRFNTLHSICSDIVRKHATKLYIDDYSRPVTETYDTISKDCKYLQDCCKKELGIELDAKRARNVYNCISKLNSSLVFDPTHIQSRQDFTRLKLRLSEFQHLRENLYVFRKLMGRVMLSDLPLYALEILQKFPEVGEEFKKTYDTVIVDEYQDMSLLQLRIVYHIAKQLTVIGDINQQIYAFQGACPEISDQFNKYYPYFKEIILKQSYRCAEKIADFSTKIVLPNKFKSSKMFKGTERENASIAFHTSEDDLINIMDSIAKEYNTPDSKPDNHMFLFRNNRSSLMLADMCFERNIPCRVNKYQPLYKQPIMTDIVTLIDLLNSPGNQNNLGILSKFIYEFRNDTNSKDNPLYDFMVSNPGIEFYNVPYTYDSTAVPRIMEDFMEVKELLNNFAPFTRIFNILYKIYYDNFLKYREHYLSYDVESMVNLITTLSKDYSYSELLSRETTKFNYIDEYTKKRIGVRLYTFHAAKGLEANRIYIIDAEEGLIPNRKELETTLKAGDRREAAVTIRNERSLCYVACTRAKTSLDIFFRKELSTILQGNNMYGELDEYYEANPIQYEDVESFIEFCGEDD